MAEHVRFHMTPVPLSSSPVRISTAHRQGRAERERETRENRGRRLIAGGGRCRRHGPARCQRRRQSPPARHRARGRHRAATASPAPAPAPAARGAPIRSAPRRAPLVPRNFYPWRPGLGAAVQK